MKSFFPPRRISGAGGFAYWSLTLPVETQITERYRRRESSVEGALMEMCLAGVSVRRVEDITQTPWGTRVSQRTVSNLNQKVYERIEQWRGILGRPCPAKVWGSVLTSATENPTTAARFVFFNGHMSF